MTRELAKWSWRTENGNSHMVPETMLWPEKLNTFTQTVFPSYRKWNSVLLPSAPSIIAFAEQLFFENVFAVTSLGFSYGIDFLHVFSGEHVRAF
ncbi:MAG: hypothetical protein P8N51_00130 [Pseudomonadales bacterium]|nr:hypothetical protein [Pseudomonadales bacterium]